MIQKLNYYKLNLLAIPLVFLLLPYAELFSPLAHLSRIDYSAPVFFSVVSLSPQFVAIAIAVALS